MVDDKCYLRMFAQCLFEALGEFLAELDEQDNDGHVDDVDTTVGKVGVDYITAEDDD